jgi:hypothetical protein
MAAMRTTIPFDITRWGQEAHDADDQGVAELAPATLDDEVEPAVERTP